MFNFNRRDPRGIVATQPSTPLSSWSHEPVSVGGDISNSKAGKGRGGLWVFSAPIT
jgi:hypothetical protein